jgi:hypothetical protein
MDEVERLALERELREHSEAIESLTVTLRQLEESLAQFVEPPEALLREIAITRTSIRARMAAINMAEGRLGVDPF